MKYIKTYEFKFRDFKVGDIVIIKHSHIYDNSNDNIFEISEINTENIGDRYYMLPYKLTSIMSNKTENLPKSAILRKLSDAEIKKIKFDLDIKKYNL